MKMNNLHWKSAQASGLRLWESHLFWVFRFPRHHDIHDWACNSFSQNQGSISDHRRLKRWSVDCQLSALTTVYIVNHTLSHFTSYSAHWQAAPNLDLNVSERLTFQQGLNLSSNYFERTASIKPSDHYRLSITCLVFSALTCSDTFYKAATLP